MFVIIAVVHPIALIAEITLGQETQERVTPMVKVIFFDDLDDLGSHEDQHVRRINRHDFDLVARESWNFCSSEIPHGPSVPLLDDGAPWPITPGQENLVCDCDNNDPGDGHWHQPRLSWWQ